MASLLSTTGGYNQSLGLPGAEATGSLSEKDTFINESTSGGIDSAGTITFGTIVAKGTADNGAILLTTSGTPIGITSRRILHGADPSDDVVGYETGDEMAIYRTGDVVCIAAENVTANDQVVGLATAYSPSTGISTNVGGATGGQANGTSRIAMLGHVWKTTTSQGAKGIVSVFHRAIAPATTS